MTSLSLRMPKEMEDDIQNLISYEKTEKSVVVRQALRIGMEEMKKRVAIEMFASGKVTLGEASAMAGISAGEMMELLACRGIDSGITTSDMKKSLKAAK